MQKTFNFEATVDENNTLVITSDGDIVSRKQLTGIMHQGHFSAYGEKIHYIYERQSDFGRIRHRVFFYPVNLNYINNPVEAELHDISGEQSRGARRTGK